MIVQTAVCSTGFEAIAAMAGPLIDAADGGALCVYLDGKPVLDVWSGSRDPAADLPWERDTMAMSWSTTKGVASTVLHLLLDRGELDLDEPVASYWPEFGAGGKASTTVRQLMAMEAGLFDIRHAIDDPRTMLDHAAMADALAKATPAHPPGRANAYHALTYGWLVGEIVRRITGRTLGDIVRTDIAEPLGLDGCYVGTPEDQLCRVAARPRLPPESRLVRLAAKGLDHLTRPIGFSPARIAAAFAPRGGNEVIPTDAFLLTEAPSVNGVFTARSLARLYAALGADEGVDGVRLWSPETRRQATAQQNDRRDLIIPIRVGWRLGYHQPFPKRRTSPTAFGFYGAFGSGAFADPERGLGVGFVVRQANGTPLMKLVPAINGVVDGLPGP